MATHSQRGPAWAGVRSISLGCNFRRAGPEDAPGTSPSVQFSASLPFQQTLWQKVQHLGSKFIKTLKKYAHTFHHPNVRWQKWINK